MGWANLLLSILVIVFATWEIFKGRAINRGMMIVYALAGLWSLVVYGLIVVDTVVVDIMDSSYVKNFCIRPMLFVLLCTILASVIRGGWKDGHK